LELLGKSLAAIDEFCAYISEENHSFYEPAIITSLEINSIPRIRLSTLSLALVAGILAITCSGAGFGPNVVAYSGEIVKLSREVVPAANWVESEMVFYADRTAEALLKQGEIAATDVAHKLRDAREALTRDQEVKVESIKQS
jgi:hypothetical protein